jgi:tetratricopeptide (TPR) repeat protein
MKGLVYVNQFSPRLEHELTRIDEIGLEYYRLTGVTTRIVRFRYRGEEAKARALEAASEASSLALGSWSTDLQRLLFAHPAYAFCHDIEGLARSLDALERRVEEGMEFATRVDITRAELLRERGDHGAAIAILERTRETLDAEDVLFRQHVGCALAQCQLEAYRYEDAERCARETLAIGSEPAVRIVLPWLRARRTRALALDALGRGEEAAQLLDATIPIAEELDCPVFAGELHEARARVAFAAGDRVRFELHRVRCGEWLRPTENPGLVAVVERLADLERDRESVPADARRRRPGREHSASRSERAHPVVAEPASDDPTVASRPSTQRPSQRGAERAIFAALPTERRASAGGEDAATVANPRSAPPSHAADESETVEVVERPPDGD